VVSLNHPSRSPCLARRRGIHAILRSEFVAEKGIFSSPKREPQIPANPKPNLAFGSAVALLALCGIAAVLTFANLRRSEQRVDHTHAVQIALAKVEAVLARAGRARLGYVLTRDEKFLPEFESNAVRLPALLQNLTQLTKDNPTQQAQCAQLAEFITQRLRVWDETVNATKHGQLMPTSAVASAQVTTFGAQVAALTDAMNAEESRILTERQSIADRHFRTVIFVVAVAFAGSLLLFVAHYRLLLHELEARRLAQAAANESAEVALRSQQAARYLSSRLMKLQDEERRKFARELHDSLGQYLALLKLNLGLMTASATQADLLGQCLKLTDEALTETRTLSYLLHPPLLDEAGLSSASQAFLEGFSKRSGINVKFDSPKDPVRLPPDIELTLFRILQEALTNVHKHSKSTQAHVCLDYGSDSVKLTVSDTGKGIPKELLSRLQEDTTQAGGVGFSGMHERVRELGGELKVDSPLKGTVLTVSIPVATDNQARQQVAP
jgi:signal transduction histidine kinase